MHRSKGSVVTVLEYLAERSNSYFSIQNVNACALDDQASLALNIRKHGS